MKLRYLIITGLFLSVTPHAHAGPPPKKIIQQILGQGEDLNVPKPPSLPSLPTKPPSGATFPGSSLPGKNPGLLDNLDELTPPKPPKASPPFKNVNEDPSVLPIEIDTGTNIEVKEPKELPFKPGGVELRQEVIIKPPPSTLVQYLNGHFGTNLPKPPKEASPKIVLVNHSYYEDWAPNFKIEVVVGKNDYVVGFDPAKPPGRPDFRDGGVTFPPGAILVPKDWYNKVLKGEIPDFRLSPDGKIQRLVDGTWVDYMNSHWPYR